MKALESLGSSSAECEALFDKFKIGSKEDNLTIYRFYYRDCLLTNYGKATAQPSFKRSTTMVKTATRIKREILKFMRQKDLTTGELFHVLK